MNPNEETKWTAIEDWGVLSGGDKVRVTLPPVEGRISTYWNAENVEVELPDVDNVADLYKEFGFVIELGTLRDLRPVREVVTNPAGVANRVIKGMDAYGNPFTVPFTASIGFNVYPSGVVTISDRGSADAIYIDNGINGTVEVI